MIKFGTDGWRAIISEEFTFENVRTVAQAVADYILESSGESTAVIGYDARFLSADYAGECARVLAANNIRVFLTDRVTPTPALSFSVKQRKAVGGIMVTASHNPYKYNGIKYKAGFGGSALPEIISAIESRLGKSRTKSLTPEQALSQRLIEYFDPEEAYVAQLRELVDLRKIAAAGQKIVIDPMHGAGAGYIRKLLSEAGLEIIEVRGKYDPLFGGVNPEPIAENLQALSREVVNQGALAGFATDGDADRVGAVDAHGEYVNSHIIYALLLRYLVTERKWTGGVVKTFSTSQMIDKLARKYGLKVFETPIGFKYICKLFLSEDILLGGEESGGLGFKNHIPERDGILASLLLMEMMATYNKPLHEIVEDLMQELGHHDYGRIDHHLSPELMGQTVPRLKANPPTSVAGVKVKEILDLDGIKLVLEDGSWILFRESGTEPMLRIYAEAGSRSAVNKLLSEGKKF